MQKGRKKGYVPPGSRRWLLDRLPVNGEMYVTPAKGQSLNACMAGLHSVYRDSGLSGHGLTTEIVIVVPVSEVSGGAPVSRIVRVRRNFPDPAQEPEEVESGSD